MSEQSEHEPEVEFVEISEYPERFRVVALTGTFRGVRLRARFARVLGEGSVVQMAPEVEALWMYDNNVKYAVPIADSPKWFKKLIKRYYSLAKIMCG